MNNKIVLKLKNESGVTLVYILIVFVVIMIYIGIISSLFQSNLLQAKYQANHTKAYYLALSGIDLAVAALNFTTGVEGDLTILEDKFKNKTTEELRQTLTDADGLEDGTVEIVVREIEIDSERWIEIVSTGTLDEIGTKEMVTFQFKYDNQLVNKRF